MPDYATAVAAMQNYFATAWGETTPVFFDDDEKQDLPTTGTWVRFNIRHNTGFQKTMGAPGANRFERGGLITIQVFSKSGNFAIDPVTYVNTILTLYSGLTNSDITYFDATPREIGNDIRGWYQINVVIAFRYDEIT